jgi:hypothetical protein
VIYTAAITIPAHTAVRDAILAGTGGLAAHRVYDASNVLLVTLPLDSATVGTVDGTTGRLTLTPGADGTAVASGTADHADLIGNDGALMADDIPIGVGTAPVAGQLVLTNTTILAGATMRIVSSTIG